MPPYSPENSTHSVKSAFHKSMFGRNAQYIQRGVVVFSSFAFRYVPAASLSRKTITPDYSVQNAKSTSRSQITASPPVQRLFFALLATAGVLEQNGARIKDTCVS